MRIEPKETENIWREEASLVGCSSCRIIVPVPSSWSVMFLCSGNCVIRKLKHTQFWWFQSNDSLPFDFRGPFNTRGDAKLFARNVFVRDVLQEAD